MFKYLRNLFVASPPPRVIMEREALYHRCFGDSPKIYHSTDRVFPHVDVYHFDPCDRRPYHTLITGGMAEYRQPVDGLIAPVRVELLLCVVHFRWWAANLLKMLAEYPAQNETYFTRFQTVPIGNRLTKSSQVSAFLLAPAEVQQRLAFEINSDAVEYLACVPITMDEHAFAREAGCEELYSALKAANLLVHKDDERPSIV